MCERPSPSGPRPSDSEPAGDQASGQRPDRYRSFAGLDCMGDAVAVLARVDQHIAQPSARDAFWERFALKLARVGEPGHGDALYLVCANVYYIADLFQARADADGLTLLARLEEECC